MEEEEEDEGDAPSCSGSIFIVFRYGCRCHCRYTAIADGKLIEQNEMKQQIKYLTSSKVRE